MPLDFDYRQVGFMVRADNLCVDGRSGGGGDGAVWSDALAMARQPDLNAFGRLDDVSVRKDVAIGRENDARAGAALLREQVGRFSRIVVRIRWRKTVRENLHHGAAHTVRQFLK